MPKKQLETLTESMYYILIALKQPRCGIEISEFVSAITQNRVNLGPGTLYTLLSKFQNEDVIKEIACEGRKRTYVISDKGKIMLEEEFQRLQIMIEEGKCYMEMEGNHI